MARAGQASLVAAIQAVLPSGSTWYVDLSTDDPGTTGAPGLATTRQAFTASTASATIPSVVSNTNAITVPTAGTAPANYVQLYSAATGGTFRIAAPLATPITSTSVVFATGAITFQAA